jgi:hypothetical protein
MAGRGGPQRPDYKPRVGGVGAAAQRMDMTRGTAAHPGQSAVNRAPTVPVTGNEGPYGQRAQLEGLAGAAPRAGQASPGRRPGAPPKVGPGIMDQMTAGAEEQEQPLAPVAPLEEDAFAGYSPQALAQLERYLPLFTQLAADPSAGPEVAMLAQLAAEIVTHNQEALAAPPQQYIGPAPERLGP